MAVPVGMLLLGVLASLTVGLTGNAASEEVVFGKGRAWIIAGERRYPLEVEIAASPVQRSRGLMGRQVLAEEAGMLFVYDRPQPRSPGFWMYRTHIPLDIAFLDAEGRIFDVLAMHPCRDENPRGCPSYLPSGSYHAALEVNQGYFRVRGIGSGDRVQFVHE